MTEIEKQALDLVNECYGTDFLRLSDIGSTKLITALCRALERHEAFRREVSDALNYCTLGDADEMRLSRFIIKPTPIAALAHEVMVAEDRLQKALDNCGLEIREIVK